MTDCRKCRNYYGQYHGGNFLFCAIHPYGNINCPDFESPTLKDRLNLCGYFKKWFSSRVEPQQEPAIEVCFGDDGLPLISMYPRQAIRASTNAFLMHCYQILNLGEFEPVENLLIPDTITRIWEKINIVNRSLGLKECDRPFCFDITQLQDFLITETNKIRAAIAQLNQGENQ